MRRRNRTEKIEVKPAPRPKTCSKDRQFELRELIEKNEALYIINKHRSERLSRRKNNEMMSLDLSFLKEIISNTNSIVSDPEQYRSHTYPKIKDGDETHDICTIDLSYNDYCGYEPRIKYSETYSKSIVVELKKIEKLKEITEYIIGHKEEYIIKKKAIVDRYNSLSNSIDVSKCYSIWRQSLKDLEEIRDHLKFEPGLQYIFKNNLKIQTGKKVGDTDYIKKLKIIKTTKEFCEYEVELRRWHENDTIVTKQLRHKKYIVLNLLKTEYTFEKSVVRSKKLERLVAESEESC